MRAIILAAGMGIRMEGNTSLPKCLLKIGKKTILDRQIEALKNFDISIVVGYKASMIIERYPDLNYVFNHDYKTTNTIYSLGLALKGDDTFVINGDVVFDSKIIELMKYPSCAAVQFKKVDSEEIQVKIKKEIIEIGKNINGVGEAVGIYRFSGDFCKRLSKIIEKEDKTLFYENAINKMLPADFYPVDIDKLRAKEIDNINDLRGVKKIWQKS